MKNSVDKLFIQFLNDPVIRGCGKLLEDIYSRAMPNYILREGRIVPVYSENLQKLIDKIHNDMDDYIKAHYPQLKSQGAV